MALLQIENFVDLKDAHREWIEEALKKSKVVLESKWTQSIAVGDFLKGPFYPKNDSAKHVNRWLF